MNLKQTICQALSQAADEHGRPALLDVSWNFMLPISSSKCTTARILRDS